MKVEFTNNALARMQDRCIREADVREVLDAPEHLSPGAEKRWHARKKVDGRTLEILCWREREGTEVITAYWQEAAG